MTRLRWFTPALLTALAVLVGFSGGCGGGNTPKKPVAEKGGDANKNDEVTNTPLENKGWATLKGKVTLDGPAPEPKTPDGLKKSDQKVCHEAPEDQKIDQTWLVSKDGGVENVVIWLEPPANKYFKVKDEDKKRTDVVKIDQPHCAFVPHVLTLYPGYYEGADFKASGQKFEVHNSAPITHNTKWQGNNVDNLGGNKTIASKEHFPVDLKPQPQPIQFNCDIHAWMQAKAWVFPHPYAATTDKDGNFEIKNVPAGVEVGVVAWHEGHPGNWALPAMNSTSSGEKVTFEDGNEKVINFKLKATK